jgi:hypothetical protein
MALKKTMKRHRSRHRYLKGDGGSSVLNPSNFAASTGNEGGGAASFATHAYGATPTQQFNDTFSQTGLGGQFPGNGIVGAQGQMVVKTGGSHRRQHSRSSRKSRSNRRGGFLGNIFNNAIVPLSLLGMQQTYRKRGGKGKRH